MERSDMMLYLTVGILAMIMFVSAMYSSITVVWVSGLAITIILLCTAQYQWKQNGRKWR